MDDAVTVALKLGAKRGQAFRVQAPARGGILAGVRGQGLGVQLGVALGNVFGHMIAFLLKGPDAPILHVGPV